MEIKKMKKHIFGKDIYFLGRDENGENYWLEAASWDCGWYWGFGYVETYTNNNNPELSRDINSHRHFDGLFLKENIFDGFHNALVETPLNNSEIWELLGYMKEFYIMREYSDLLNSGNRITSKAKNIKEEENETENKKEYKRINEKLMPELFEKIYKLLTIEAEPTGIKIFQCKNKYGYTTKQLQIDYDNKTFSVGSFTIGADKTITKKALNEKIEELKNMEFKEM